MAKIVILGLTITSSWGNGHATTYRALVKALAQRGHDVLFLEREAPWYGEHRDLATSPHARIALYHDVADLKHRFTTAMREADAVIVGSFVPDGIEVGDWAIATATSPAAFYDIDTPVTLAKLERGDCDYLSAELIAAYDLYLSFTGGPVLDLLQEMGSPQAAALYCSADPELHAPVATTRKWELGYLGTYSPDRQIGLEWMLLHVAPTMPAKYFVVAGAQYPSAVTWPDNVLHIEHLPPAAHPEFYCGQRFTLNLTRDDMKALGFSPSVRLFEAAACGVPIITDSWPGLDTIFDIRREILIAESTEDVLRILRNTTPAKRKSIATAARRRVLNEHTAAHRALELEKLFDLRARQTNSSRQQRRALVTS
ncbi:MAG TPA: glycosyltransferase [Rhizomicrobium sp.]|jgi:spore maturation protein CgeB|nr:glycosyltransferase [Rhizomicrobium sp.]